MRAAFIGNESKIAIYSKLIHNALLTSDSKELTICGVMSVSPEATTNLAIELNAKAYLSLDDLIKDADIIFVCRHDSQLAAFSDLLKEKRVRGKILCHFSSRYDSSVLCCGSTNTYYSVSFPYMGISSQKTKDLMITFEGEGKHCEEFMGVMSSVFPKAVFCTKNDKRLSGIAGRVITDYLKFVINISMKFFKLSGQYDEDCFTDFVSANVRDITSKKPARKIHKKSESDIRKDMRLLSVINYSDSREFYKNMETHIADTGIYTPDERETVLRTLRKRF